MFRTLQGSSNLQSPQTLDVGGSVPSPASTQTLDNGGVSEATGVAANALGLSGATLAEAAVENPITEIGNSGTALRDNLDKTSPLKTSGEILEYFGED